MEYVYEDVDGQVEVMLFWILFILLQDDSDIYFDLVMCFMYEVIFILEVKLFFVYVRKEWK